MRLQHADGGDVAQRDLRRREEAVDAGVREGKVRQHSQEYDERRLSELLQPEERERQEGIRICHPKELIP